MNLLVLSYYCPDFQILKKYTISTVNQLIKKQNVFITLINVYPNNFNPEELYKEIDNNIEIKNIAFSVKKNQLSFIESFLEPENKTKFIGYLEEILIEKTFDIIQFDSIIFSVFMENFISLSQNSLLIYRQYFDEVSLITEFYKNSKLQLLKNLSIKKLTNKLKNILEFNIKKFNYVITAVPEVIPNYHYINNYFILPNQLPNIPITTNEKANFSHKICFAGPLYLTETQRSLLWFVNETWEKLQKEIPDIELHLYGKSEKWFTEIITKNSNVFYHSPDTYLDEFLEDKTIVIIPHSRAMGIFNEVIHAIKKGKIIIAHTEAVHGWELTAMINFMPARSAEQFIEAILHIYEKNEIQEYFSKQISKFANEKFTEDYLVNILMNFYKLIIKNGKYYGPEL